MKNPKYIGAYTDDGLLNIVYQVHEIIDDVYVLEAISYLDLIYFVSEGYEPSQKPVLNMICERKLSEIENPRLFYSWMGIASEFIRAEKERDRRERSEFSRAEREGREASDSIRAEKKTDEQQGIDIGTEGDSRERQYV